MLGIKNVPYQRFYSILTISITENSVKMQRQWLDILGICFLNAAARIFIRVKIGRQWMYVSASSAAVLLW